MKTKVPTTVEEYGSRYCLIGPLSPANSPLEVEEEEPEEPALQATIYAMRSGGVRVIYGKWLVEGAPAVILFDLRSVAHRLAEWKSDFLDVSRINSPANDQEMNDAILFGYLTAWFLGEVLNNSDSYRY